MNNQRIEKYEITVGVISYNPDREKLFKTITSIIEQKNVSIQLIVADDGSQETYYNEIEFFLKEKNYTEYRLVRNEINQGTVKNCFSAAREAKYSMIKLLSPGDYFSTDIALYQWAEYFKEQNADWSFCDAYYYFTDEKGNIQLLECNANPQYVHSYQQQKLCRYRWDYLAVGDLCLGAATLFKTDVLLKYLEIIQGKVKYAEDNVIALMMLDKLKATYYEKCILMYEYGTGISTVNSSEWQKKIREDYVQACKLMLDRLRNQGKRGWWLRQVIAINMIENRWLRNFIKAFIPGVLVNKLRKRRKTPTIWLEESE